MAAKPSDLIKITGHDAIRAQVHRRGTDARSYRATVGYRAPYAIFVHEDLTKNHPTGQAKFLEQPAREQQKAMSALIKKVMRRKNATLKGAVQAAADLLLEESKKLVPVDTGALRDSGYATVTNYRAKPWSGSKADAVKKAAAKPRAPKKAKKKDTGGPVSS